MNTFQTPMWINGRKLSVLDLFAIIPVNQDRIDYWRLVELSGIGIAPGDMSMEAFEKKIRSEPQGLKMSKELMNVFLFGLRDVNEITLAGYSADDELLVEIDGFDSAKWTVVTH